jgi:hypothetical protein
MSGKALYFKFALLMLAVALLASFLGNDPWGPI